MLSAKPNEKLRHKAALSLRLFLKRLIVSPKRLIVSPKLSPTAHRHLSASGSWRRAAPCRAVPLQEPLGRHTELRLPRAALPDGRRRRQGRKRLSTAAASRLVAVTTAWLTGQLVAELLAVSVVFVHTTRGFPRNMLKLLIAKPRTMAKIAAFSTMSLFIASCSVYILAFLPLALQLQS